MARLGTRDLRALLDVVGAIGYEPETDALSLELLSALQTLVDAVWTDYIVEPAPPAKTILLEQSVAMAEDPWEEGPWQDVFWDLIGDYPIRAAPRVGVLLMRDVTTRRALHGNPFFQQWVIPADRNLQAMVTLPDRPDGAQRSIMFNTEATGRAFGERQRAILETVRPYLCRPIEAADAVRRRQRAAGLTARELEILAAVREGLTNAEIAARLVVSPATVRTHLANASAKLGAHTRSEAVALAWR